MKQGLVAVGLGIAVATAGCASAPAVAPAPVVTDQQKMSWILQLEDQRILKVIPPPAPGLIGDPSPATAVGQMVSAYIKGGAIASIAPDDETWPGPPDAAAVRLGLFALVRLKGWDALSSAVLDGSGNAVSAWWPIAYALQRIGDPRAAHPLE